MSQWYYYSNKSLLLAFEVEWTIVSARGVAVKIIHIFECILLNQNIYENRIYSSAWAPRIILNFHPSTVPLPCENLFKIWTSPDQKNVPPMKQWISLNILLFFEIIWNWINLRQHCCLVYGCTQRVLYWEETLTFTFMFWKTYTLISFMVCFSSPKTSWPLHGITYDEYLFHIMLPIKIKLDHIHNEKLTIKWIYHAFFDFVQTDCSTMIITGSPLGTLCFI